jgi:hypothetical protein
MYKCGLLISRSLAALAMLLLSAAASANSVVWTLDGVTFDDGGTASGQFTLDADRQVLRPWSISVAGGNTANFPALTYSFGTNSTASTFNGGNPQDTIVFELTDGSLRQLRITPSAALTDSGGTIALDLATAHNESGGVECFNCGPARIVTAGSLVGVPEALLVAPTPTLSLPAMLILIGSFLALGFALRRS